MVNYMQKYIVHNKFKAIIIKYIRIRGYYRLENTSYI